MFLFGDQGGGKSNFIRFFLSLFGEPASGISLLNSTEKGFSRSLTQRTNALYYLKEYSNALDQKAVDVFKTSYDGELYTMAQKSADNKTTTLKISSACMVDGNELPTSEAALFARMIVLDFENNTFSDEATEAFNELSEEKEKGFGSVTRELLKCRGLIEKKFRKEYEEIFFSLKSSLTKDQKIPDRQISHLSLLLTPVKLLKEKLNFPFDYETYKQQLIQNTLQQEEMSSQIKDVTIFWEAIAFKVNEAYTDIREHIHYKKGYVGKILFVKLKLLYPYYADYAKKNNLRVLD